MEQIIPTAILDNVFSTIQEAGNLSKDNAPNPAEPNRGCPNVASSQLILAGVGPM